MLAASSRRGGVAVDQWEGGGLIKSEPLDGDVVVAETEEEVNVGELTVSGVGVDKMAVVNSGGDLSRRGSRICSSRPTPEMGVRGGVMTDFLDSPSTVVAAEHVLMVSGDRIEVAAEDVEFCATLAT